MILLLQSGLCLDCFGLDGQNWLNKFEELSFFRSDLLIVFLLIPAG